MSIYPSNIGHLYLQVHILWRNVDVEPCEEKASCAKIGNETRECINSQATEQEQER